MDCSIWCLIALIIIICIFAVRSHKSSLSEGFVVSAPWPYKNMPQDYYDESLTMSAYPKQKEVYRDEASAWGDYMGDAFPCGKEQCGNIDKTHIGIQQRNGKSQKERTDAFKTCKKGESWGIGFDTIPDGKLDKGFEGAGGHENPQGGPADLLKARKEVAPRGHPYRRQEHVGYRWKESWLPYYWKTYPNPPIWTPARNPAADQPEMPQDPKIWEMMAEASCRPGLASQGISPEGYRYFWKIHKPYEPLCSEFADQACRYQPYPHFCYRRAYGKCIHGAL